MTFIDDSCVLCTLQTAMSVYQTSRSAWMERRVKTLTALIVVAVYQASSPITSRAAVGPIFIDT